MKLFKTYASAVQQLFPEISFDTELLEKCKPKWRGGEEESGSMIYIYRNFRLSKNLCQNGGRRKGGGRGKGITIYFYFFGLIINNKYLILLNIFYSALSTDTDSKRKVFENFAKENNFDPLNPEHWYSQKKKKMLLDEVFPFSSSNSLSPPPSFLL